MTRATSDHGRPSSEELTGLSPWSFHDPVLERQAAALAHNVNNRLSVVIGYLELVLCGEEVNPTIREYLSHSMNAATQVARLIQRLMLFANQLSHRSIPTIFPVLGLVERLALQMREANTSAVTVLVEKQSPGWVYCEKDLFALALEQVVANALEAMGEQGTLLLRVWVDGDDVYVGVQDTGPGLAPAVAPHMFKPFITTKVSGHLGLGLVLCQDAMQALGGVLTLEQLPDGMLVVLRVPQYRQEPEPLAEAEDLDSREGSYRLDPAERTPAPRGRSLDRGPEKSRE